VYLEFCDTYLSQGESETIVNSWLSWANVLTSYLGSKPPILLGQTSIRGWVGIADKLVREQNQMLTLGCIECCLEYWLTVVTAAGNNVC
jgi:hypothetical protein